MFVQPKTATKHLHKRFWVTPVVLSATLCAITIALTAYIYNAYSVEYAFITFVATALISTAITFWYLLQLIHTQIATMAEVDRQKDELLSIVSHQLATPISSMQYLLELFQDGDFGRLTSNQAEQMLKLQASVRNASELVRMILDVNRIQMGKMTVHTTMVNLEQFVDGVLDVLQPKITEKNIRCVTTITRPMPTVELDEYLLRMSIVNILGNAIKYTKNKGTIWFEASVRKDYFYCKVTDTGPGIPEAEQDMLYEKLYRASNVRDTVPGTGFGLYVAKGAVEAQGGLIQFHSKIGKGTTFYIQVPIVKTKHSKKATASKTKN